MEDKMDREERECIVFENTGEVGFPRKKGKGVLVLRMLAVAAVVLLALLFAWSGIFSWRSDKNRRGEADGGVPPSEVGDSESSFDPTEGETSSGDTVGEEIVSEESGSGESEDEAVISVDLSRSEMGDCYAENYTDRRIDYEGLIAKPFSGAKHSFSEAPLVMIVHTYTGIGYSDYDESDPFSVAERGVVAVGSLLADRLNCVGISTVHVTVVHDEKADPYAETVRTVKTMLEIYPSVEYVIDLGRFEARDRDGRPIRTLSGKGSAQIRLTVSTFGERWRDDLSLALKLRRKLNLNGANLCLPPVISESSYSSGNTLYYLKMDVGTDANSSHEALFAAECFADALEEILKK